MAPEEQQEFWNGMSQSEQIAFAQAMEHPHQVQPKPDQAKGAKSRLFQQGSRPIFTYTESIKTSVAGEKKLSLYRTNFEDAGVAGDYVSPTSTNYSARMNKTVLGVVMVVVFCITWWLVAGEAMQVAQQAAQAVKQAQQAYQQASQAAQQAEQAFKQAVQAYQPAEQAALQAQQAAQKVQQFAQQAQQASIMADAHWRTQGSWGIGAGLLADVLLLVGIVAWQKITFKP